MYLGAVSCSERRSVDDAIYSKCTRAVRTFDIRRTKEGVAVWDKVLDTYQCVARTFHQLP